MRASRLVQVSHTVVTPQHTRKINIKLGLKRCYDDINEFFGLYTTGDRVFYHVFLWTYAVAAILSIALAYNIITA